MHVAFGGRYTVCWCAVGPRCTKDGNFSAEAGRFSVRGPIALQDCRMVLALLSNLACATARPGATLLTLSALGLTLAPPGGTLESRDRSAVVLFGLSIRFPGAAVSEKSLGALADSIDAR